MPNRHKVAQQHPSRHDPFISDLPDWRARKLISPLTRPADFWQWRALVADVIRASCCRHDARVSEEQIDQWAERGWVEHDDYDSRWDHSVSMQTRRSHKAAALRTSKAAYRWRRIWIAFQRGGGSNATLAALFAVSVRTVQRAKAWGRERARRPRQPMTAPCMAIKPYRSGLTRESDSRSRVVSPLFGLSPATAEGGQQ